MKERYVPIDEANQAQEEIQFFLPFPDYVDRRKIGVNLPKLQRLCRIGGISALGVFGEEGEVSSASPDVTGITSKGEAMASNKGTKKPELLQDFFIDHLDPLPGYPVSIASLRINLSEAVNRAIEEKKQATLRDTETWTKYLDVGLRKGLTDIGVHNSLAHGKSRFIWDSAIGAVIGAIAFSGNPWEIAGYALFFNQMINMMDYLRGKQYGLDGYNWSLTTGIQPDRAIALTFLANRGNLIKALPKSEK